MVHSEWLIPVYCTLPGTPRTSIKHAGARHLWTTARTMYASAALAPNAALELFRKLEELKAETIALSKPGMCELKAQTGAGRLVKRHTHASVTHQHRAPAARPGRN